jgi:hypothetical protein
MSTATRERGSIYAARRTLAEADRLLRDAKLALERWHRLHYLSVTIGRAEQAGLADGALFAEAIQTAREIVENADRTSAEIAKHLAGTWVNYARKNYGEGSE